MMTDGIINVNKPAGWTSQDVCAKLRHVLRIKKIGHTGTLDPMATGVLPVCVGKATRIIEYYDKDAKTYHAAMKLGVTTDTLDITGEVLSETGVDMAQLIPAIRKAFEAYRGVIAQVPPKYSALKINGKRAYDLARAGADFEIKAREITIYSNEITSIDAESGVVEFDVTCSKGTYIRTICDDIGRELGCGATMTALTRTASGYFKIEDSHMIEEIIEAAQGGANGSEGSRSTEEMLEKLLIPADVTLEKLGRVRLNDNRVIAFRNGNSSYATGYRMLQAPDFTDSESNGVYRVYSYTGNEFLGIASIQNGSLVPQKVLI